MGNEANTGTSGADETPVNCPRTKVKNLTLSKGQFLQRVRHCRQGISIKSRKGGRKPVNLTRILKVDGMNRGGKMVLAMSEGLIHRTWKGEIGSG